jgi:hypothetical protein
MSAKMTKVPITITVRRFCPVLETSLGPDKRGTSYKIEPIQSKRVRLEEDGKGGCDLVVQPGTTDIEYVFTIKPDSRGKKYFPRGIVFVEKHLKAGKNKQPKFTGQRTVPRSTVFPFASLRFSTDGQTLTMPYHVGNPGQEETRYKFSVIIQHEDGATIGIIDPGIDNPPKGGINKSE